MNTNFDGFRNYSDGRLNKKMQRSNLLNVGNEL